MFSTIHAKSIRGVYERLLELGVSEDELAVVLQGVCYQRLIGGGGIIDFAKPKIIQNTRQKSGMSTLISFLKMDISLPFKLKRRKLATSKQKKIITLFNNLFSSGFHLVEIISFLDRSLLLEKEYVSQMRLGLSKENLSRKMMGEFRFFECDCHSAFIWLKFMEISI